MTADEGLLERLRASVPANVRAVCETLARAGYQAVTVGGAVRDAILGRAPGDWDVATSALPEQVIGLFRQCIPTGLQHGTVTVVTGRGEESHVEVTTFRGEGEYTDARRPDSVTFGVPLVEDLARRDLRVNAMAYDPAAHALIDPFHGQVDIAEKILRAVGPTGDVYADAVARFSEDGLRVMRAVRFAAVLEFALDPDTARGIEPALPSLARVSRERVSDELRKILAAREPSRALGPARATGILRTIAPALDAALGSPAMVAWHTITKQTWEQAVDRAHGETARLAAMFAPLGMGGDLAGLDRALAKSVETLLRDLKFANDELRVAAPIVATFGAANEESHVAAPIVATFGAAHPQTLEGVAGDRGFVRRLMSSLGRDVATVAAGVWAAFDSPIAATARAILAANDPLVAGELAVSGKDLMAAGIPAGPKLGETLRALLAKVLEDPTLNTRDQLLALVTA